MQRCRGGPLESRSRLSRMNPRPSTVSGGLGVLHRAEDAATGLRIAGRKTPTKGLAMPHDPRLAPIANPDGSLNRSKVEALLGRSLDTLTIPELEAMDVLIFEPGHLPASQDDTDHPLVGLAHPDGWLDAFVKVT